MIGPIFRIISKKGKAYHSTFYILKKPLSNERVYGENKTKDQLIKDTLICLEDDDFEKANLLIGKIDPQFAVDQNIEFLKTIIDHSHTQSHSCSHSQSDTNNEDESIYY